MHDSKFYKHYQERYGSGANVVDFQDADISDEAAAAGVDWSRIKSDITWQSGKAGKLNVSGGKLLKGFKNSVGVYASIETDKNGVEFPLITFKSKGGAGHTGVFNGLTFLWEEFKREKDAYIPQSKLDEWDRAKRLRAEDNARKQSAALAKHDAENKRRSANVQKELQHFDQLPSAVSFVYTDQKFIGSILPYVDARTGTDKNGNYLALKLHHQDGKPAGLQRIYDRKITKKDGSKTNKDFTWGMDKSGAHLLIGDLAGADRIYVVEGFATGASVFMAMQHMNISCAVIVAIDADNMIKVVQAYQQKAPYLELKLALDNDMWKQREGKGNKGMLIGMDLLTEFDELRAYAPNFNKVDACYRPTDWNDLHLKAGLKEVARQLKGNVARVKCEGDLFEKSLQRLGYIMRENVQREAAKCVQMGMTVGMPKYKPSDVVATIRTTAQAAGISSDYLNVKELNKKASKIWHAKVKTAQTARAFSERITNAANRPDHIEYHKFNKSVVDDEVLNFVKGLDGIVLVRFPMASGKTQKLIKPLIHENENSLFSAHRMSLIGGSVKALNEKVKMLMGPPTLTTITLIKNMNSPQKVINYQEPNIKEMMPGVNKLASCINSILRPEFMPLLNNLDIACFDEAAQTLRHVTAGGAIKYPVAVFNRWLEVMATTKGQVILADADANDTLVDFCELGLNQRNAHLKALYGEDAPQQKIHIIDGHTDCSDTAIYYTDADTAFKRAADDVGKGFNVLIANDSANDGEKLFTHLQNTYPDKKGLFVSLDTKEDLAVERFTDDPNGESKKYDYLIYSPSISSGVSIENKHFNKHYGIFCGTVAPSDAIQMIRRDRNAREFVLGLATMHSNREESAMAMWLGMILANDNNLAVELNRDNGTIELKTNNLEFDRLRLDLIAQENQAKNDFANNLLCILFADQYKLAALDTSEIEKELGTAAKEAARDQLKAIDMSRHVDQDTPTNSERDTLLTQPNLSREDKASLNRWDIENALMLPVDEDSVKFHHRGGLSQVRLFELMNMSPEAAREFDKKEIEGEVQPSHRLYLVKQRQALRDFFELAGISWETGQGTATAEKLTSAIEHLISGDNIHLFNNWYKFGGYVNPFSRNVKHLSKAKSILEALGLKLESIQLPRVNSESASRVRYFIKASSWEQMSGIHERRVAAHASAFKMDNLDNVLIHSSPDTYIGTEEKADQTQAAYIKGCSLVVTIKRAIENLRIPLEYAPKIMAAMTQAGDLTPTDPGLGIQTLVERIYGQLRPVNPV